jgi:hypothetical protein
MSNKRLALCCERNVVYYLRKINSKAVSNYVNLAQLLKLLYYLSLHALGYLAEAFNDNGLTV